MRFISYVTISITWMILSTSMVYFFIKGLWMPKAIAKTLQIFIMAIPLYIANRLITFKNFTEKNENKNG